MNMNINYRSIVAAILLLSFPYVCAAKKVYCSASGRDSNPGTKDAPVLTVDRAIALGDEIMLKRGDVFYEPVVATGKTFDAYGAGAPPLISGLRTVVVRSAWKRGTVVGNEWRPSSRGNVWRIDLTDNTSFSGPVTGPESHRNNIGAVVNLATGSLNGTRKVPQLSDMSGNYDICQPFDPATDRLNARKCFDYLYLYLDTPPASLPLGLTCGIIGVELTDCKFRNIDVKYWSRHGFQLHDNTVVENVTVDAIGGSVFTVQETWGLIGNGIECWVGPPYARNIRVRNCMVSRCFDAGITVQGRNATHSIMAENISFDHNTIHNCCQGWEGVLNSPDKRDKFRNVVVKDNLFYNNGFDTGFRYHDNRFKRCQLLGNSPRPVNLNIRDNIFVNGNFLCCSLTSEGLYNSQNLTGNVAYVLRGQFLLSNYIGTAGVIRVPEKSQYPSPQALKAADDNAIAQYRELTGDNSTVFIIVDSADDPRITRFTHPRGL